MRIARTKALEFPATVSKRHGRTARTDAWFTDRELMRRKLAVSVAGLGPQDRWDRTPALPSPPYLGVLTGMKHAPQPGEQLVLVNTSKKQLK